MATDEEKRKKREQNEKDREAIRKAQEKKNWERRQRSLEAAAEQEARERLEDEFLDKEFLDLFNVDAKLAREYMEVAMGVDLNDEEAMQAYQAFKEAQKAKEGGWLTGPNPDKAKKIIKKNQGAIRNTIKKGKKAKGGWCSLVLIGLLTAGGGALYAAYEGVSAVASALF